MTYSVLLCRKYFYGIKSANIAFNKKFVKKMGTWSIIFKQIILNKFLGELVGEKYGH